MGEGELEYVETGKKGRHRKKQLYNTILSQMEFYFSDSNLSKDRFLSQLLEIDNYIGLEVFLSFNKIRKLNCTADDIRKAINKSELIELSKDNQGVKRRLPIKKKENADDCTVYIENVKDHNHDWLIQVFSDFGNVVYVSIPKCKDTKTNKGFAFVEFETEEEAEVVLKFFEKIGSKIPLNIDPGDLASIRTHKGDGKDVKNGIIVPNEVSSIKIVNTKRRFSSDEEEEPPKRQKINVDMEESDKSELNDSIEIEECQGKMKKKLKKVRKKSYFKELGLTMLSKKEWKRIRNTYLNLQRQKIQEFKRNLRKHKKPLHNSHKKEEKPAIKTMDFVPGVIVQLTPPKNGEIDVKKLKSEVKSSHPDIKYVDVPISFDTPKAFLRFSCPNSAKEFCKENFPGEKVLLTGEEEKCYWERLQKNQLAKFSKDQKRRSGKEKVLKKAGKIILDCKHLKFEDTD